MDIELSRVGMNVTFIIRSKDAQPKRSDNMITHRGNSSIDSYVDKSHSLFECASSSIFRGAY